MKNNNYKPRIIEFKFNKITCERNRIIDTRKGAYGFYPGDEISIDGAIYLIVGYDVNERSLQMVTENNVAYHCIIEHGSCWDVRRSKLIKRHAQHLIDNGEMIQVG
jgi:hypothetical protein